MSSESSIEELSRQRFFAPQNSSAEDWSPLSGRKSSLESPFTQRARLLKKLESILDETKEMQSFDEISAYLDQQGYHKLKDEYEELRPAPRRRLTTPGAVSPQREETQLSPQERLKKMVEGLQRKTYLFPEFPSDSSALNSEEEIEMYVSKLDESTSASHEADEQLLSSRTDREFAELFPSVDQERALKPITAILENGIPSHVLYSYLEKLKNVKKLTIDVLWTLMYRSESYGPHLTSVLEGNVRLEFVDELVLWNKEIDRVIHPKKVVLASHAQRKEHTISMLNRVEQTGSVEAGLRLRSKSENIAEGVDVNAYSPSGSVYQRGSAEVSTNLGYVQNGYGTYVWVFPPAQAFYQEGTRFTFLGSVDNLADATGEIGLTTPLGLRLGEIPYDTEYKDFVDRATQLRAEGNLSGFSVATPESLCLIPRKDYDSIMFHIDSLDISDTAKTQLKRRFIPYASDDPLGNQMMKYLQEHPEVYTRLVQREDPDYTLQDIGLNNERLHSANFTSKKGIAGYTLAEVPALRIEPSSPLLDWKYEEYLCLLGRLEDWDAQVFWDGLTQVEQFAFLRELHTSVYERQQLEQQMSTSEMIQLVRERIQNWDRTLIQQQYTL